MKVLLAGYNLDVETVNEIKNFIRRFLDVADDNQLSSDKLPLLLEEAKELVERDNFTPETISAAYARISRNPKPVNELREIARKEVNKARKSNQNIIFGLGHSSVAEHATFNFDIIGVSRLAVETIEHFRLASYTEKSQRYILFKDDYVIPKELEDKNLQKNYIDTIKLQNDTYFKLYEILRPYFFEKNAALAENPKNTKMIEGWAKEDARYIISLATQTQLGMTVNARTLENMISKSFASSNSEIREFALALYNSCDGIAPSIVKYYQPSDYLKFKEKDIHNAVSQIPELPQSRKLDNTNDVLLLDYPDEIDQKIIAHILFRSGNFDYLEAEKTAKSLDAKQQVEIFSAVFKNINAWDSVIREFEFIYFTFQFVVSAGNFGQLKRHRMSNIISQNYDINLGITIPESIKATGQTQLFKDVIEKTNATYLELQKYNSVAANYILTNAHRRRVLFKINLRELYHFIRLRADAHAQWDIRNTAIKMHDLVKEKMPLAGSLLAGKDKFKNE